MRVRFIVVYEEVAPGVVVDCVVAVAADEAAACGVVAGSAADAVETWSVDMMPGVRRTWVKCGGGGSCGAAHRRTSDVAQCHTHLIDNFHQANLKILETLVTLVPNICGAPKCGPEFVHGVRTLSQLLELHTCWVRELLKIQVAAKYLKKYINKYIKIRESSHK